MIAKRILAGISAIGMLACTGCTAQELAAMQAGTSNGDSATPVYTPPDTPFPPPQPTPPSGAAIDVTNGHLLTPFGPDTWFDPTTGTVLPPGSAVIPQ